MDKETSDRHYRIVGALQGLQSMLKYATCMPCDSATEALLVVARHAIDQAVLSAWSYANDRTRVTDQRSDSPKP